MYMYRFVKKNFTWSSSSSDSSRAIGANSVHSSASSMAWLNEENLEHLHTFMIEKIVINYKTSRFDIISNITLVNFVHFRLHIRVGILIVAHLFAVVACRHHISQMIYHFRTVDTMCSSVCQYVADAAVVDVAFVGAVYLILYQYLVSDLILTDLFSSPDH